MLNIRNTDDIRNVPIYFAALLAIVFVEYYICLVAILWYLQWLAGNHPELWAR